MMPDNHQTHTTITLELTPDQLRQLGEVLNWAVFQLGYTPRVSNREDLEALAARVSYQAQGLVASTSQAAEAAEVAEQAPGLVALRDYLNIFVNANDTQNPYHVFLFRNGVEVDVIRLHDLTSTADLCRQYGLKVVTSDPQLGESLRTYGIEVQASLVGQ